LRGSIVLPGENEAPTWQFRLKIFPSARTLGESFPPLSLFERIRECFPTTVFYGKSFLLFAASREAFSREEELANLPPDAGSGDASLFRISSDLLLIFEELIG